MTACEASGWPDQQEVAKRSLAYLRLVHLPLRHDACAHRSRRGGRAARRRRVPARAAARRQGLRGLLGISRRQSRSGRDRRTRACPGAPRGARDRRRTLLSLAHARLRLRACARAAALPPGDALVGRAARPGGSAVLVGADRVGRRFAAPACERPHSACARTADLLRHQQCGGGRRGCVPFAPGSRAREWPSSAADS